MKRCIKNVISSPPSNNRIALVTITTLALSSFSSTNLYCGSYPLVDTGQQKSYSNSREISQLTQGKRFYGQDAHYLSNPPHYQNNGNGTVSDLVTGLTWSKAAEGKYSLEEAEDIGRNMTLAGYTDWRVPTIKELYSLIDFRGYTGTVRRGSKMNSEPPGDAIPFINTDYFDFAYGDLTKGERFIDAQWLSSTKYVSRTMGNSLTLFGVNFADGRLKGYGYKRPGSSHDNKKFYVRFVRGNQYGENDFVDNGDGTVTDKATGLMWMEIDSKMAMNWEQSLKYSESLNFAGYDDWRLPDIKELQSIVDYCRSPDTSQSAAIDSVFQTSSITNEKGQRDFPYFWSSTTHLDGPTPAKNAAYISFGRAIGQMRDTVMDVHGAGSQRSDPKIGSASLGKGPQGDSRRVMNYVRCVRGGNTEETVKVTEEKNKYPNLIRIAEVQGPGADMQQTHPTHSRNSGENRFVSRFDMNGDNRVSQDEFRGPSVHFNHLDSNNDGFISETEAPTGPPSGQPQRSDQRYSKMW